METPAAPRASGEADSGCAHHPSGRTVAHRYHRDPPARRDGAYLHAVIDNFSRRILAWRVAGTFAPVSSVAVLLEASQHAPPTGSVPVVLADAGAENLNAQVDALIATGVLRRRLALTDLTFCTSERARHSRRT